MRVFMTGATGEVGGPIVDRLIARGDRPVLLTRSPDKAAARWGDKIEAVRGNPLESGAWQAAVRGCDAVIHLVGEPVAAKRWTKSQKELIYSSRVGSTRRIVETLRSFEEGRPQTLVCASAIGYYGNVPAGEVDERSPPGKEGFLTQLCIDWERETFSAAEFGVRAAAVRVGLVLAKGGQFLKAMTPFRYGLGFTIGDGRQQMSWIHVDDLARLFLFALDRADVAEPLNGTAPNPHSNRDFSKTLAAALHRPLLGWAPGFVLKTALGEFASLLLEGARVIPRRPLELGFRFEHPELRETLDSILSR